MPLLGTCEHHFRRVFLSLAIVRKRPMTAVLVGSSWPAHKTITPCCLLPVFAHTHSHCMLINLFTRRLVPRAAVIYQQAERKKAKLTVGIIIIINSVLAAVLTQLAQLGNPSRRLIWRGGYILPTVCPVLPPVQSTVPNTNVSIEQNRDRVPVIIW